MLMHTLAFLVRCWQDQDNPGEEASNWRFLVMDIGSIPQTPRGFADFDELVAYLQSMLADNPPTSNAFFPKDSDIQDKV